MGINKKIFAIQENRDAAIAALDTYLDHIYRLNETFFDKDGKLLEGLTPDKQLEDLITSSKANADIFENVRQKLIEENYHFNLIEINYIGLAFFFCQCRMKNKIEDLELAIDEIKDITAVLFEGDKNLEEVIQEGN